MEMLGSAKRIMKTTSAAHKKRMSRDYSNEANRPKDARIWSKDLEPHAFGEYSFAAVQANNRMEDQSQVDAGPKATFVGIYDGHNGDATAVHIRESLLTHFVDRAQDKKRVSERILKGAIADTEDGWINFVREHMETAGVTRVGSCCLVGLIWDGRLYVGNLGDSRAVIGRAVGNTNKVIADEITEDHNANLAEVRNELKKQNKDDPRIVVKVKGVWRVKELIQVSRSIGDLYLKMREFVDNSVTSTTNLMRPALSDEPFVTTRDLQRPDVRFVVFASDGLWENMTSQEAVEIVSRHPRAGVAKTLVAIAMKEAAMQKGLKYDKLPHRYQQTGERRAIHDDITVAVIFFDNQISANVQLQLQQQVSVKGLQDTTTPSALRYLVGDDIQTE